MKHPSITACQRPRGRKERDSPPFLSRCATLFRDACNSSVSYAMCPSIFSVISSSSWHNKALSLKLYCLVSLKGMMSKLSAHTSLSIQDLSMRSLFVLLNSTSKHCQSIIIVLYRICVKNLEAYHLISWSTSEQLKTSILTHSKSRFWREWIDLTLNTND
jgi:hypothetical protein